MEDWSKYAKELSEKGVQFTNLAEKISFIEGLPSLKIESVMNTQWLESFTKCLIGIRTSVDFEGMSKALMPLSGLKFDSEYMGMLQVLQTFSEKLKSYHIEIQGLQYIDKDALIKLRTAFDLESITQNRFNGIDYKKINDFVNEKEQDNDQDVEEILTLVQEQEVIECLANDLQNGNNDGFQEKVYNWTEKQKKKYFILFAIIHLWFSVFVTPYLQENVGIPVMTKVVSFVRDLPNKASEVIESIEENVCCRVTQTIPYWVQVKWEENGTEKSGWIAKRNIIYIDSVVDDEENEDMNKMELFRKTDTTLVHIASAEFAKEIMKENYQENVQLYIHIKRDTGFVIVYADNDINKVVHIEMKDQEYILKSAKDDR